MPVIKANRQVEGITIFRADELPGNFFTRDRLPPLLLPLTTTVSLWVKGTDPHYMDGGLGMVQAPLYALPIGQQRAGVKHPHEATLTLSPLMDNYNENKPTTPRENMAAAALALSRLCLYGDTKFPVTPPETITGMHLTVGISEATVEILEALNTGDTTPF